MVCKGICIRHKANKPYCPGRYTVGQKRCQICEMYLKWNGFWCPCCGCRLRIGPRLYKHKAKLIIKRQEQQLRKAQNRKVSILHVH